MHIFTAQHTWFSVLELNLVKVENVLAIANTLQLEAARRRAVPVRFNFVARAKFDVAQPSVAVLERFYCLYVMLRCKLEL